MRIRNYLPGDADGCLRLWNTAGRKAGYAPLAMADFSRLLLRHADFSPEYTFVLDENGQCCGFLNGCAGDALPRGDERGYVGCLLLDDGHNDRRYALALLDRLEASFRRKGLRCAAVTFFNPIRLPWLIPGTPGHQHNNMPGVPTDLPLNGWMREDGYRPAATEMAMYLNLADFVFPDGVRQREAEMARSGYTVDWYREGVHQGLDEMVEALENSMWSAEIPAAGHNGLRLLVGLRGNTVAGFTGPVYPEPTGRGYFAGIGVAPAYEKRGLGTLLFYKLCEAEKACGAAYLSLFTGIDNHAQAIYRGAGFTTRRFFDVMVKEL